jgi:hypothetical protein
MVERSGDGYRFTFELFRRWIRKNQVAEASPEPDFELLEKTQLQPA